MPLRQTSSSICTKGATQGAPHALQIVDRWHLLKNLGEALQKLLGRHRAVLQQAGQEAGSGEGDTEQNEAPAQQPSMIFEDLEGSKASQSPKGQRQWQLATYHQVHALAAQGLSRRAISKQLQIHKQTVRKYLEQDHFLDRRHFARPALAEPYRPYLQHRWAQGCTNVKQLWRELQEQGFTGGYKSVWNVTRSLPSGSSPQPTASTASTTSILSSSPIQPGRTPQQVMWLLLKEPERLKAADRVYCQTLCRISPQIATASVLVRAFTHLVRQQKEEALDAWLDQAIISGVKEVRRFALGIRTDEAPVHAALREPWSQGQVEGQIHRLKLLKRQSYGRAGFDLLRHRVLARSA